MIKNYPPNPVPNFCRRYAKLLIQLDELEESSQLDSAAARDVRRQLVALGDEQTAAVGPNGFNQSMASIQTYRSLARHQRAGTPIPQIQPRPMQALHLARSNDERKRKHKRNSL